MHASLALAAEVALLYLAQTDALPNHITFQSRHVATKPARVANDLSYMVLPPPATRESSLTWIETLKSARGLVGWSDDARGTGRSGMSYGSARGSVAS